MSSNFFSRYSLTVHSRIYFAFVFFFLIWFIAKTTALSIIEEIYDYIVINYECCRKLPCVKIPDPDEA